MVLKVLFDGKISLAFYSKGDFFSSPLDEQYTYYGFAYVENNPKALKLFASPLLWLVVKSNEYDYSLGNKPILPLCV
jgi:hypothetical protein